MGVLLNGESNNAHGFDGGILQFKQRYLIATCSDAAEKNCGRSWRVDDLDQTACVTTCSYCGSFAVFIERADYTIGSPTKPVAAPVKVMLPTQPQPVRKVRHLHAVA